MADEEVLGNDGELVKNEEQEKVEAEEDAVDAADEGEIKGEELIGAEIDVPTEENARDRGDAGEQNEHAADAVGGEQVVNAHGGHPKSVDDHPAALAHAGGVARNGDGEAGHGHDERKPTRQAGFAFGQQR